MSELVPSHLKRLFRLRTYFRPYPDFSVVLSEREERLRVLPLRPADARQTRRRFLVQVPRALLTNDAPDHAEQTILRQALALAKRLGSRPTEQLEFLFRAMLPGAGTQEPPPVVHATPPPLPPPLERVVPAPIPGPAAKPEASPEVPCLRALWQRLREEYFPDRADLDDYRVQWSWRRHTVCLASCSVDQRRVLVAAAMQLPGSLPYLEPLVYHEMCHAVLGRPKVVNGRRVVHGREFKALERLHPEIPKLNQWIRSGGWHQAVKDERKERRKRERMALAQPRAVKRSSRKVRN